MAFSWRTFFFQNKTENNFEIYTDGSVKNSIGSWAYVIVQNSKPLSENSGRSKKTTSTHMEFQAAIEALKTLPKNSTAIIYSDSKILIDAVNSIAEWKNHGWTKKDGRPLPLEEKIMELDQLTSGHALTWQWIKAHSGIEFNERCDQLCTSARLHKTSQ